MKNHECIQRFHCISYGVNNCNGCANCINHSVRINSESAKKFINEKFGHGLYNYIMAGVAGTDNLIDKVKKELEKENQEMDHRLEGWIMYNKREEEKRRLKIKKVIFNEPATIVFWEDGTKTVVKCGKNDIYDKEKGLAMCIAKRALGDKGNYYNEFSKWLPVEKHK